MVFALMNYNFKEGKLKDFTFGDIYLSAMQNVYGNFAKSIQKTREILSITGNVLPITLDEMNITAELANGYIVTEKSRIPEVVYDKITKIKNEKGRRNTVSEKRCQRCGNLLEDGEVYCGNCGERIY